MRRIRQERVFNCRFFEQPSDDGQSLSNDLPGDDGSLYRGDSENDIDVADILDNLDSSGFGIASSCPAPITVNLSRFSIEFSLEFVCMLLSIIRPVVLFAGFLQGAFIIFRGCLLYTSPSPRDS